MRPDSRSVPASGTRKPPIMLRVVVFPQPEGPRMHTRSFSATENVMLCRTIVDPNCLETAAISSSILRSRSIRELPWAVDGVNCPTCSPEKESRDSPPAGGPDGGHLSGECSARVRVRSLSLLSYWLMIRVKLVIHWS